MHREHWWNGNAANFPRAISKGHFDSSLCGGISPSHRVSPSTQLMGVTVADGICSQVPCPGSGTLTISGPSILSLDLGVETLWGNTRIVGGVFSVDEGTHLELLGAGCDGLGGGGVLR